MLQNPTVAQTTRDRLVECIRRINQFGPDHEEVRTWIESNNHDEEFVELARLSCTLKHVLGVVQPDPQPADPVGNER